MAKKRKKNKNVNIEKNKQTNKTNKTKKQQQEKKMSVLHIRELKCFEKLFWKSRFGGHSLNGFEVIQICRKGEPLGSEQGQLTR